MTLLSLPLELLIRTFTHLSISSIHALSCTNKFLRNAIAESIELRALEKCIRHSAEFHPASCLSLDENLRYLEVTESRWASGVPRCAVNVPLPGKVSGIYDLCGGNYVLGDSTRRTLYSLSTRHPGLPEWKRIDVNREVVDLGLSIYEHDLVAYVTLDRQGPKTNLILFFAEYSTGLPHPQARESTVLVETYTPHDAVPFRAPSVGIEIVGEYLVLLVLNNDTGNPLAPGGPMDTFCVLEWKTGKEMLVSDFLLYVL
ncbi:hypothetical protein DL96DRAFT_1602661 [Flagelloscypha sp. PMI_526]|nr:hypothetical protein DL96DRAFT_1602661 [Flagelloscypha sp. PMI_526]